MRGGYGSWYWLVACGIGLSAYLGLSFSRQQAYPANLRCWYTLLVGTHRARGDPDRRVAGPLPTATHPA